MPVNALAICVVALGRVKESLPATLTGYFTVAVGTVCLAFHLVAAGWDFA